MSTDHLKNPWWRETLVLRGGISKQPDTLVRRICSAIDRTYMSLLGVYFTHEGPPQTPTASETATLRLDGIVAIEVALACVRQRASEIDSATWHWIEPLLLAVARRGSLIEQVRVARSLLGVPLDLSEPVLTELAKKSSDWLVNEVFAAVDPREYRTPHFAKLLEALFSANESFRLFERLWQLRSFSLLDFLRYAEPHLRTRLFRATFIATSVTVLALMAAFGAGSFLVNPNRFALDNLATTAGQGIALAAMAFLFSTSLLFAGTKLTLALFCVGLVSWWIFPSQTAARLVLVMWMYSAWIGTEFRRAKWIGNPVTRFFALSNGLSLPWLWLLAYAASDACVIYIIAISSGAAVPRGST